MKCRICHIGMDKNEERRMTIKKCHYECRNLNILMQKNDTYLAYGVESRADALIIRFMSAQIYVNKTWSREAHKKREPQNTHITSTSKNKREYKIVHGVIYILKVKITKNVHTQHTAHTQCA